MKQFDRVIREILPKIKSKCGNYCEPVVCLIEGAAAADVNRTSPSVPLKITAQLPRNEIISVTIRFVALV